jgi:hypothetical protein
MAYVSDAECSYVIQVKYIILKFTGMPFWLGNKITENQ